MLCSLKQRSFSWYFTQVTSFTLQFNWFQHYPSLCGLTFLKVKMLLPMLLIQIMRSLHRQQVLVVRRPLWEDCHWECVCRTPSRSCTTWRSTACPPPCRSYTPASHRPPQWRAGAVTSSSVVWNSRLRSETLKFEVETFTSETKIKKELFSLLLI